MPTFPSPIPTPSARMALPPSFLTQTAAKPAPRLSDAAEELHALLLSAGYSEQAYYELRPGGQTTGFALVTRIERIRSDGTPFPAQERFLAAHAPERFDVLQFLKSLFVAPVGYYRVLVFTVSTDRIRTDGPAMTDAQAETLLNQGASRLAGCIAQAPYTRAHAIDALVYEFRHAPEEQNAPDKAVSQLLPSQLAPDVHLRNAGIFVGLNR
ncbi:MAG: hypothetical protein AAF449_14730 [Myxococcota bacterium]